MPAAGTPKLADVGPVDEPEDVQRTERRTVRVLPAFLGMVREGGGLARPVDRELVEVPGSRSGPESISLGTVLSATEIGAGGLRRGPWGGSGA